MKKFTIPKFTRKASSLSSLDRAHLNDMSVEQVKGPVKAQLGNTDVVFHNGIWQINGNEGGNIDYHVGSDQVRDRKINQQLKEENHVLKVKIDILLDMLSETTAEVHLQENEIDNLKSMIKSVTKRKS